ncbi:MAG: histidine phosphatase family protein [Phycisphaerae bacterium]
MAGLCFIAPAVHAEEAAAMQSVKTVYLVRHAEKANEKEPDPVLSEQGAKRAAALSQVLRDVPVSSIFCTPYKRSQETAKPLADAK